MERKKEGFVGQRAIVLPETIKRELERNELTRLLHITDIGYYPNATGHYRVRRYGAKQHILIYCVKGAGEFCLNDVCQQVRKDQFFILEAGLPHVYGASATDPWSIYWLHFTGEKSHLFQSIYNKVCDVDDVPEARPKDRLTMFEEMYANLQMGYSVENLEYTTLCLWHFLASFRYLSQFREINKIRKGDIIHESIDYMRQHIEQKLTLECIASAVNYSPSHFGQVFMKKTGYTPMQYLTQLKIQRACQLLDFSGQTIKQIAETLGFYDQYHFSKVFFRQIGETPTSYKNRDKG